MIVSGQPRFALKRTSRNHRELVSPPLLLYPGHQQLDAALQTFLPLTSRREMLSQSQLQGENQ
jgi:hypothetical protein